MREIKKQTESNPSHPFLNRYQSQTRKESNYYPVKLTGRDLEILEFVLEMKFASLNHIFERFFSITKKGERARSIVFADKRIRQLEYGGFLKATRVYTEPTRLFLATDQAVRALEMSNPKAASLKALKFVNNRIFIHDKYVLESRLQLERDLKVTEWLSDRKLCSGLINNFGLHYSFAPDAIYTLPTGERIAFEMEVAQKPKADYRKKIESFVRVLRNRDDLIQKFDRVHIRCLRSRPYQILKEETEAFKSYFDLEFYETEGEK